MADAPVRKGTKAVKTKQQRNKTKKKEKPEEEEVVIKIKKAILVQEDRKTTKLQKREARSESLRVKKGQKKTRSTRKKRYYDERQKEFYEQLFPNSTPEAQVDALLTEDINAIISCKDVIKFELQVNTVYQMCGNNKTSIRNYVKQNKNIADQIWFYMEEKHKIIKISTTQVEHSNLIEYCAYLKKIFNDKKEILHLEQAQNPTKEQMKNLTQLKEELQQLMTPLDKEDKIPTIDRLLTFSKEVTKLLKKRPKTQLEKEIVDQELIIAQLKNTYTVVFSNTTLTEIATQYEIALSDLEKLNPTLSISSSLLPDTEVQIPSVNVFEHNYKVCKQFCADQKLNCITDYLFKKLFPEEKRVSYLTSFKNNVEKQFVLLQDRIESVEHYIVENIINEEYINKIIRTIATQNGKPEETEKFYVAHAYEIEHITLFQFRVFKIENLRTCEIDNSDYLDLTFNLQEIRKPKDEEDILSNPWTVESSLKKQTLKTPVSEDFVSVEAALQVPDPQPEIDDENLFDDFFVLTTKPTKGGSKRVTLTEFDKERQEKTRQLTFTKPSQLDKWRQRKAARAMISSTADYSYYVRNKQVYETLTSSFIEDLVKNDISNVAKIDRLDKICNLQRIAFPVMQMVIWFVSHQNCQVQFCNVNEFPDAVQIYVDSAYDRNNEDSDAEADSEEDVRSDVLRKKDIKKKQKKDAQEKITLDTLLNYMQKHKQIDKITSTTNVADFIEKNAEIINKNLNKKGLDAKKLQTQITAFFIIQKEKAIKKKTQEELKPYLELMRYFDKVRQRQKDLKRRSLTSQTDLEKYFDTEPNKSAITFLCQHTKPWYGPQKTKQYKEEDLKKAFVQFYTKKRNNTKELQVYLENFYDKTPNVGENAAEYFESHKDDLLVFFADWLENEPERDKAIEKLQQNFVEYYDEREADTKSTDEDSETEVEGYEDKEITEHAEDEDAPPTRKRKKTDENTRHFLIQWRNPKGEDDRLPKRRSLAVVNKVSRKRKAAVSVDADTRHPLLQWRGE